MIAISRTNSKQKSIKNYIELQGIGLHSGIKTKLKLEEAPEDNGIKFIRQDKAKNNIIEAIWSNVTATKLSTTISNKSDLFTFKSLEASGIRLLILFSLYSITFPFNKLLFTQNFSN